MPHHDPLYLWRRHLATRFPELPSDQSRQLADWSFGIVHAKAAHLTAVASFLAVFLAAAFNTLRQRLRELYQPARRKAGSGRTEFDPRACWVPLLRWVTDGWTERKIALALDATTPGDRFTVLAASVLYRGSAVPVAWRVLRGNTPKAWNACRVQMLRGLAPALDAGWFVCVLTDRGLESRTLYRAIVEQGWHPLMRAKAGGTFRPEGATAYHALPTFVPAAGHFAAAGTAFRTNPLACTLLAMREPGCDDPWLILTDLPPDHVHPAWYGFRAWIEAGFRHVKRGGWNWQRTRITDPERAERLWAALAVAELWVAGVGGEAEAAETREPDATDATASNPASARPPRPRRIHRVTTLGLHRIVAGLIAGTLLLGAFLPEPWPPLTVATPSLECQKPTPP